MGMAWIGPIKKSMEQDKNRFLERWVLARFGIKTSRSKIVSNNVQKVKIEIFPTWENKTYINGNIINPKYN